MRMTAIRNGLMRTRALPIQCRTNEVDSHSGNNINKAFDSYIISVLPGQTMMIILCFKQWPNLTQIATEFLTVVSYS